MTGADFLDTNILVYAYDSHFPKKQQIAQNILLEVVRTEHGVISTQVLSEFFTVITKKVETPLSVSNARDIIHNLGALTVQEIDFPIVKRAIATLEQYQISYWDAQIIAAAERARCSRIFSEDLNAGQKYHEIEVVNPFVQ
jgi:predicted nucleic acid-binding protein